jgi:hypothetical protein
VRFWIERFFQRFYLLPEMLNQLDPRRLDKALFQQTTAGKWIAEHRNLLVTGPCGGDSTPEL